jgi:hypothetical protein
MRAKCCVIGILLVVAGGAAAEDQQPEPRPDPVSQLYQALRAPTRSPEARANQLRAAVDGLRTVDELRRALLLSEWRDIDLDENVAAADARLRATVVERFERGMRAALRQGELDGRLATLKMIVGLDVRLRGAGDAPLARDFTADLAELTRRGPAQLRAAAARTLGGIHPEPEAAVAALAAMLKDTEPSLRAAAAEALSDLAAKAMRHDAARAVAGEGADEAIVAACAIVPVAAGGLEVAAADVRRGCAASLEHAARGMAAMVQSPSAPDEVEDWEAYQRGVDGERAALWPLAQALQQRSAALAKALGDSDVRVRVVTRHTLEAVADARLRLLRRASSALAVPDDQQDREAVARSLTFLRDDPLMAGLRPALTALASGLTDADVGTRRATIDVLETLGRQAAPAAPALVTALSDRDRFVRRAAARALGKIRPTNSEGVVTALSRLLGDADGDVRLAAAGALREYGPGARSALPALVEVARVRDVEMRLAVVRVLESIGSEDAASLAVLGAALTDADARVREVAAQALERVGPSQSDSARSLLRPPAREEPAKAVGSVRPR